MQLGTVTRWQLAGLVFVSLIIAFAILGNLFPGTMHWAGSVARTMIFSGVVFLVIRALYNQYKKEQQAIKDLAKKHSWKFEEGPDYKFAKQFKFLENMDTGSNRYASRMFSGGFGGHSVLVFDYHYETYTGFGSKQRTDHHYRSYFIIKLEKSFPELKIGEESVLSKLVQALGFDDIDFESHEFSRRFKVNSKDKKFAYDFCNAQMIDYLLTRPVRTIEVEQEALALTFDSSLVIEEIENHLGHLVKIRSLMPDYLFSQQGS